MLSLVCSGEENYAFSLFHYYFPLKKGWGSTVLRRGFFNFVHIYFCYFVIIKALKRVWPFNWKKPPKPWIPFTKGCFVLSLLEISSVDLEKKMNMWKVYRRRWTDRGTKDNRCFQIRWAKNYFFPKSKMIYLPFANVTQLMFSDELIPWLFLACM